MNVIIKEIEEKKKINKLIRKFKTYMVNAANEYSGEDYLSEGTKVKLNYKWITENPAYSHAQQPYKDFIEKHKDDVFTVEYDDKYRDKPYLVCLKEDDTPIKWLWHSLLDLIVVN